MAFGGIGEVHHNLDFPNCTGTSLPKCFASLDTPILAQARETASSAAALREVDDHVTGVLCLLMPDFVAMCCLSDTLMLTDLTANPISQPSIYAACLRV